MTHRIFTVSNSKAEDFLLNVSERPTLRNIIGSVTETLCLWTGHRFEHLGVDKIIGWAEDKDTKIVSIPINREQADLLATDDDTWSWLDEPEMSDSELDSFIADMDARIDSYNAQPWFSKFVGWVKGK